MSKQRVMPVAIFSTPGRGVDKDLTMSSVRSPFAQPQLIEQQQALFFISNFAVLQRV
jgi:hypothetical protein